MAFKQLLLKVQVCSARNLKNKRSGKSWVQVVLSVGSSTEYTLYKKCSSQAAMFWNQTFMFGVDQKRYLGNGTSKNIDTLYPPDTKLKVEVKTKRESVLGVAVMSLPEKVNQMQDVWIPLIDPETNVKLESEVHLFLQLEYKDMVGNSSVVGISQSNIAPSYSVGKGMGATSSPPYHPKSIQHDSSKASSQRQHAATLAMQAAEHFSLRNNNDTNTAIYPSISSSEQTKDCVNNRIPANTSNLNFSNAQPLPHSRAPRRVHGFSNVHGSSFENEAAAASINEYFNSLESIQQIIKNFSDNENCTVVQHDDLDALYRARDELGAIRIQIQNEAKLDKEWRERLLELIDKNNADLSLLIDTESWEKKYKSIRNRSTSGSTTQLKIQPPPLPVRNIRTNDYAPAVGPSETTPSFQPPPVPSRRSLLNATSAGAFKYGNDMRGVETEADTSGGMSNAGTSDEFEPEAIEHSLDSLEAFDALMDFGYAIEVKKKTETLPKIATGMTVELEYVAYVWDSASSVAVSFRDSNSNGNLNFVVGEETDSDDNDVPKGLSSALLDMCAGTELLVTITPEHAFGESGAFNGDVPPNTHIVYHVKILSVSGTPKDVLSASQDELGDLNRQPSFTRNKFPARINRVSVSFNENDKVIGAERKFNEIPPPLPRRDCTTPKECDNAVADNEHGLVSELRGVIDKQQVVPPLPFPKRENWAPPPIPVRNSVKNAKETNFLAREAPEFGGAPAKESYLVSPQETRDQTSVSATGTPLPSLEYCLRSIGLKDYIPAFADLGLDTLDDFKFAQTSDFENMKMKPIHKRKLREQLKSYGVNADALTS